MFCPKPGPLNAEPETRSWVHVVYLGGDPRKQGMEEAGKEGNIIEGSIILSSGSLPQALSEGLICQCP